MTPSQRHGFTSIVVALLGFLGAAAPAFAQKGPPAIIRPPDDRQDYFEVSAELQAIGDSVCALILRTKLQDNGDGTFTLNSLTLAEDMAEQDMTLCENEPFADQPAGAECSVSLIASDVVVSAGHCLTEADLNTWYFVFGYFLADADSVPTTFTTDQVYTGAQVLGHENVENTARDWTVVRLDRAVTGRTPIGIADAAVVVGHEILTIGFGAGLPMKFSANATVKAMPDAGLEADLDIIAGNSGGPVFDAATRKLIGVISADLAVEDFFQDGECFRATQCPADDICQEGFTLVCATTYAPFQDKINEVLATTTPGACGTGACGTGTAVMAPAMLVCLGLRRRNGTRPGRRANRD